jgi:diaminopimelate decarboxylase
MGLMNKFGRQHSSRTLSEIDGVSIEKLVAQYGSPLFVFSERTLVANYRDLHEAFTRRYPRVRIAWSYKTNYNEAICRTFHREGAWAEVVSPFEYEKALRSGVAPSEIHFNGPYKSDVALSQAASSGTIIHVDNFEEIVRLEDMARSSGRKPRVAVRVNMAIDGLQAWSRFGFNLESGQARDAVRRVRASGALELVGLHTHIGTYVLEPAAYASAALKLARFANELRIEYGIKLAFLDIGGGFASPNALKGQYLAGEQPQASFSRYADAITQGLTELDYPSAERPTLVLETGRALVDSAGYLVTTVQATKRQPDGQRGLILDAGVNLLFTSFWYNHAVSPTQDVRGSLEPTVLYGPLCMNIDIMRESVNLPPMAAGQRLVFRNVGAYNMTQWMQFITLRPAVVMISSTGETSVIPRGSSVTRSTTTSAPGLTSPSDSTRLCSGTRASPGSASRTGSTTRCTA